MFHLSFCSSSETAFVLKLILRDEILSKNVNISPKSKMMETDSHVRFGEIDTGTEELKAVQPNSKGMVKNLSFDGFFKKNQYFL